jgi:ribosomal protein S18 acetylase RimI-like enzyme
MAELSRLARAELAPSRGGSVFVVREARAEPVEESLRSALGRPDDALLVGTLDGVIVGYGSAMVEVLRDGRRLGVIEELFVEPGAREAGVGEVLMTALLEWAAAQRCAGMDATALPGNRATKNFFEANGFTARLLIMHRRLDSGGQ